MSPGDRGTRSAAARHGGARRGEAVTRQIGACDAPPPCDRTGRDLQLLGKRIERFVGPKRPGNARFRASTPTDDLSARTPATPARSPLLGVLSGRLRSSPP